MKNTVNTGYIIVRKCPIGQYTDAQTSNIVSTTLERSEARRIRCYGDSGYYYSAAVEYKIIRGKIKIVGHYNFQTI